MILYSQRSTWSFSRESMHTGAKACSLILLSKRSSWEDSERQTCSQMISLRFAGIVVALCCLFAQSSDGFDVVCITGLTSRSFLPPFVFKSREIFFVMANLGVVRPSLFFCYIFQVPDYSKPGFGLLALFSSSSQWDSSRMRPQIQCRPAHEKQLLV